VETSPSWQSHRQGRAHTASYSPIPAVECPSRRFLSQPRFEYAPIRHPHREEVAMRVFRANDKMSTKRASVGD
jgi:hypothetical protein